MARNWCHDSNAAATAAAAEPFTNDPFWDSWDQPKAAFDSNSDAEEPMWQEEFHGPDCDWGKSLLAARQAEVQCWHEEHLCKIEAALAATKERMQREADEEAAAAEAKAVAEEEAAAAAAAAARVWRHEVERTNEALAHAKPAQALHILYSLFADESFINTIDMEEQANIAQMVTALEIHHEFQKSLSRWWNINT